MNTKQSNPKDMVGTKKAPMSTVSAPVLAEVGVAMLEGALKYGRHNYRAVGVRASVYYDATMRHLMSWWEGEDIDPDSGMPHIVKAITSLVVLRDAQLHDKCEDDRPPSSGDFLTHLNKIAAELVEKYADRNPKHYTIADDEPEVLARTTINFAEVADSFGLDEELVKFEDGWIENTGVAPDCEAVQVKFRNGYIPTAVYDPDKFYWSIGGVDYDITHYRVVK